MAQVVIKVIILGYIAAGVSYACCPDGWTRFQGSCYLSHHTLLDFHDAEGKCEELGGNLVHIESSTEQTFITSFIGESQVDIHWIGLQDGVVDGLWKWQGTDEVATYTNWNHGEPNGRTTENCAAVEKHVHGRWADITCTRQFRPLCEIRSQAEHIIGSQAEHIIG